MLASYNAIHKCRLCNKIIKKSILVEARHQQDIIHHLLIAIGAIPNDLIYRPIERNDICTCSEGVYGITDLIGVETISKEW